MTDEPASHDETKDRAEPTPEPDLDPTTARALSVLKARHPLDASQWDSLAPSFVKLASGKNGRSTLHPAFACFSLLLGHAHGDPDGLLGLASHESLLGPLIELGTTRLWGELCAALRTEPMVRHAAILGSLLERERDASKARLAAQATLNRLMHSLTWALPSLVPLRSRVALRTAVARDAEDLRSVTAYTDGRDIFLPGRIALFETPVHNELAYVRLLVHEALHLSEGSFAASACQQAERYVFRRLRARDRLAPGSHPGTPPTLRSISELFGEHSELFFSLLNCVEDSRIERRLPQYLPGFAAAAEYVDRAVHALTTPVAFEPVATQLLRAVLDELIGRSGRPRVPAAYASAYTEVRVAIGAFHALPAPTLAESIPLATDLCLWFLQHVESQHRAQLAEVLQRRRPITAKAYEHHVDLLPPGRRPRSELRPRMRLEHVSILSSEGEIVPEYDFWDSRVRERGASVEEHPWDPLRAGVVGRAVRCEAAVAEPRPMPQSAFRTSGARLDPRRLVRLLAAHKAGGTASARIFRGRERTPDDAHTTVVVDLSVSMVHYRPDGVRPLERAVGWIEELASQLGDGAPLTLWGCIDGGPEKVRMFRLKERGEPLNRTTLESLHGYSLGGFRMGAILRSLAQKAVERTRVFLLTDAGSHYVTRGVRRAWDFERKLCSDCPKPGSLCDLERAFPDELWIGERATIFEPLEYEVADIRHALESTAHVLEPHVVMLTEHWGDELCDHTFGAGRWSKV